MMIRLIQGDCLEIMENIGDNSVDFILTDVPYLISKKQNFKNLKDYQTKNGESNYNCMDFGEWDEGFDLEKYLEECYRILKPSRSIIVWCSFEQLAICENFFKSTVKGKDYGGRRLGVWEKSNPSVFNMQRMAIQPFETFMWWRKGSNWTFNNQNDKYFDKKGIERQKPERHSFKHPCVKGGHPTAKPIKILEHLILTYTNENDIVFDGCMGGGSCGVASIKNGRNFIGIELDKDYFKIAKERIENEGNQLSLF